VREEREEREIRCPDHGSGYAEQRGILEYSDGRRTRPVICTRCGRVLAESEERDA
jgi:DNA-directed RNA polymerase subunit RPC12/RpoP